MVEGAKSFFRSTFSEIDEKNFQDLSISGTYTNLNLIVLQLKQM
jgi:hypothetical protein